MRACVQHEAQQRPVVRGASIHGGRGPWDGIQPHGAGVAKLLRVAEQQLQHVHAQRAALDAHDDAARVQRLLALDLIEHTRAHLTRSRALSARARRYLWLAVWWLPSRPMLARLMAEAEAELAAAQDLVPALDSAMEQADRADKQAAAIADDLERIEPQLAAACAQVLAAMNAPPPTPPLAGGNTCGSVSCWGVVLEGGGAELPACVCESRHRSRDCSFTFMAMA